MARLPEGRPCSGGPARTAGGAGGLLRRQRRSGPDRGKQPDLLPHLPVVCPGHAGRDHSGGDPPAGAHRPGGGGYGAAALLGGQPVARPVHRRRHRVAAAGQLHLAGGGREVPPGRAGHSGGGLLRRLLPGAHGHRQGGQCSVRLGGGADQGAYRRKWEGAGD